MDENESKVIQARNQLFDLQSTVESIDDPRAINLRCQIVRELDLMAELFHSMVRHCSDDE